MQKTAMSSQSYTILFSRTAIGRGANRTFERGIAIVALTKWGVSTSTKIAKTLERAQIRCTTYAPRKLCSGNVAPFDTELDELFRKIFKDCDAIVAVMAVGIVVRCLAPLIVSKSTDPAIVVVDDLGKHVISLLSGHIGGANKLAKIIANGIDAVPVITTATDVLGKKCVEEIAEEHDLSIVNSESLVIVNSAIVNEKRILIVTIGVPCPEIVLEKADVLSLSDIDQLKENMSHYDAGIVIGSGMLSLKGIAKPMVILTPRTPSTFFAKNEEVRYFQSSPTDGGSISGEARE